MSRIGDTRWTPGKLIDSWIYEVKDITLEKKGYNGDAGDDATDEEKYPIVKERIVNRKVTIEVKMEKVLEVSDAPPHPLDRVKLYLTCKELDIKLEGTDLEALRAAMWAKLDERFAIKWERYYLVEVGRESIHRGTGTGMTVSYDDVYKGTTHDGKLLMRRWAYREEKIEPWPGRFKSDRGKVIACIEATEANRLALEEFCKRMDLLREKLSDFLKPENIAQTLANLHTLRLLPPPEPEPEPKKANAKTKSTTVSDAD